MDNCHVLLSLMAVLLATFLVGCSRPPELVGIVNAAVPTTSVARITRQKMFIATTRQASEAVGAFLASGRAPELGLASVDVTIPPNHVLGQLERPKALPPDPRTEFTVVDPIIYRSGTSFISRIDRELAKRPPGRRTVLLFVHG